MDDEKRRPEEYGSGSINAAQQMNTSQAEPGVTIGRSALRAAISDAERAVDDTTNMIQRLETERDEHVRQAGRAQEALDRLRGEHSNRTRHVRNLLAARDRS
jgi:septal ring factor EnvC (AmiA/AmiB activator)